MTPAQQLDALTASLAQLRLDPMQVVPFARQARQPTELLATLGPRFTEVLYNLLDRLESSALFAEESCSFSQKDLLDSLQLWLDKAALQLALN